MRTRREQGEPGCRRAPGLRSASRLRQPAAIIGATECGAEDALALLVLTRRTQERVAIAEVPEHVPQVPQGGLGLGGAFACVAREAWPEQSADSSASCAVQAARRPMRMANSMPWPVSGDR